MKTENKETGDDEQETEGPSHNFAAGKNELELPTAKPLINRRRPVQTRARETGSGCFGSNRGGAMMGGATLRPSCGVSGVMSGARIGSKQTELSHRWQRRVR